MSAWQEFLARVRRAVRAFEADRDDDGAQWSLEVHLAADANDGGWVATCPSFPGAAAQGETQNEALQAMSYVLADMIELRLDEQLARTPPEAGHHGQTYRVALSG